MLDAKMSVGTTLSIGGVIIGELTNISPPLPSTDSVEVTNLSSPHGFREFIPGLSDGGEVTFTGNWIAGDEGQMALRTAAVNKTIDTYIVTFPSTIGAVFTFTGFVTEGGGNPGEVNLDDPLMFEVTIKVTGKPNLGTTASAGLSALSLSGGGTLSPDAAAGVGTYSYTFTTQTGITVTVTAASHTIKMYVDDVYVQDLTSGSASGSIAGFSAAGTSKKITVIAYETGKNPRVYNIAAVRTT